MHIAVCDDNIADRKQLERLLKRESDKRASTTGILYTDSFGNSTSLLHNPRQYDAFYIDMCKTEDITGVDVVNRLLSDGINVPIILCCSDIDYRQYSFPENVIFMDKPIKTDALSKSIDLALQIKKDAVPLIELREEKDTFYVTEPDILYCIESDRHIKVTLTDGRILNITTELINFFSQIENHLSFVAPSNKAIINCRHIAEIKGRKAVMADGTVFKVHPKCLPYTKKMFREYHQ
ncbi:MAG: hypothetical protein K6G30_08420 [Acetatifactor sp.]|nr:hypothetical protein [Acetatifactor sp.]